MRSLIFYMLLVSLAFAYSSPVAKFGKIDGDVYILRHGKLMKVYTGFEIDEYDTVYSKNFSYAEIVFNNQMRHYLNNKQVLDIRQFMDENKMFEVKTHKQLEMERKARQQQPASEYENFNSKFYKQRFNEEFKKKADEIEERQEQTAEKTEEPHSYVDRKRSIVVESDVDGLNTEVFNDAVKRNINTVESARNSDVEMVIIRGKSSDVSTIVSGKNAKAEVNIGSVKVK